MTLNYYTNNAYDSITLLNAKGEIVGAWANHPTAVKDFFATEGGDPSNWDANEDDWRPVDGNDILVATINADGKLTTDDDKTLAARRDFWNI